MLKINNLADYEAILQIHAPYPSASFSVIGLKINRTMDIIKVKEDSIDSYQNTLNISNPSLHFVREIEEFIALTNSNNDDKYELNENAISTNRKMQQMLQELKTKLEQMIKKCQQKYNDNEVILKNSPNNSKEKEKKFYRSYNFCGMPFFKNSKIFSAPPNNDYLYRRDKLYELFPVDLLTTKPTHWTLTDKVMIIQGVKNQVVEYLSRKKKISIPATKKTKKEVEDPLSAGFLVNLLPKCDKKFNINWYRISVELLKHRHGETSCEAMWNMYLRPELNRTEWTPTENSLLASTAEKFDYSNWSEIATEIPKRSEYQCYLQYCTVVACKTKSFKWTRKDDELLTKVVQKCRMNNIIRWSTVQQYFPNLSKKQLHFRYQYSINPIINREKFTKEEDCVIMAAVQEYGENFSQMPPGLYPGRTIIQVRNRWHNTLKFSGKHTSWSVEEDKKLLGLVKQHGEGNWKKIAPEFNRARSGTRQRYLTITKYLEKYPNTPIEELPRARKTLATDITRENWVQKIVDMQSEDPQEKEEQRILKETKKYYKSLRCLEKQYYQFFKVSYDFSFTEENVIIYNPVRNLNFLTNLYHLNISNDLLTNNGTNGFTTQEHLLLKQLVNFRAKSQKRNCKNFLDIKLPPNWPTLLGFRAVCIQCASTLHIRDSEVLNNDSENTKQGDEAKVLFRKRFYSLFYKTALLSRLGAFFLPSNVLLENNKMIETYNSSTLVTNIFDDNTESKHSTEPGLKRKETENNDDKSLVKKIKLEQ